jgi:manganese/iron transport system substrate-binding protein
MRSAVPAPRRRPILGLSRAALLAIAVTAAVIVAACTAAGGGSASGTVSPAVDGVVRVVTTTTVLADLVKQVGGDRVSVESIVPKGGEVHTFDPSPSDVVRLADARLVVLNGLGLDGWLETLVADAGSKAPVVKLGEDLPGVDYLAGDEHEGEAVNPHLWLDVGYAMAYVDRIARALAEADPANAAAYEAGGEAYNARLSELDSDIRDAVAAVPPAGRRIVSFHEAFPYYAAAYGLEIVGVIVDAPGQDPSAGEIAALVDEIRASGARAVVAEAQFSPDLAETVATEAGVQIVQDLHNDSLGDPPADTYEGMMRWNTERIVAALMEAAP